MTSAPASKVTTVSAATTALVADELTITSPAFAEGAPIPVQYSCKGANIVAPPLAWSSAPAGAGELALVVDDPDAVRGLYVHWIVAGIAAGSGSTVDGQIPDNGRSLPNSGGRQGVLRTLPADGYPVKSLCPWSAISASSVRPHFIVKTRYGQPRRSRRDDFGLLRSRSGEETMTAREQTSC